MPSAKLAVRRQLCRRAPRRVLYSLVQSCTLIGVPPCQYLKDVLRRLPTHPHRLIDR